MFKIDKTKGKLIFLKIVLSPLTNPILGIILGLMMVGTGFYLKSTYSIDDPILYIIGFLLSSYSLLTFLMAISRNWGIPIIFRKLIGASGILFFLSGIGFYLLKDDADIGMMCMYMLLLLMDVYWVFACLFIGFRFLSKSVRKKEN